MPNYGYGKQSRQRKKVYLERCEQVKRDEALPTPTHLEIENLEGEIKFSNPNIDYVKVLDGAFHSYFVKANALGLSERGSGTTDIPRGLWHNRFSKYPTDLLDIISRNITSTGKIELGENVFLHIKMSTDSLVVYLTHGKEQSKVFQILEGKGLKFVKFTISRVMWHYTYAKRLDKLDIHIGVWYNAGDTRDDYYGLHLTLCAK